MDSGDLPTELNSSQARHLLTSAQYADRLFGEIESVLFASKSKSPFRKYQNGLSPSQIKIVEDYLVRIRAQLVHVLEAQGIHLPDPQLESVHSIRTKLAFVRLSFEDCLPKRMRGYGEVSESKARELTGLVEEIVSAVAKLDSYLAQGIGEDLQARLERLAKNNGGDLNTIRDLERIINDHGLVEFRSTLYMIIDRLESKSFDIALFGRVNTGKSSLINSIVHSEILPVGVNPITAVPTRLIYGPARRLIVRYADKNPEQFETSELSEFVTEQHNPANLKHVTQVLVELPCPRLTDGVVFVDTPGLGSLATSGAAETLAYLPRCDFGVVLIDAGSTLTEEDLSTIRALYEAGVPVSVLLSKSDLLAVSDRTRSLAYVSQQISAQLGLNLRVYPVSVQPSHLGFLDDWFKQEILPLYERHQKLTQESIRRKIGALREAVQTTLRTRLEVSGEESRLTETDFAGIAQRLRNAAGRFADARGMILDIAHEIQDFSGLALATAAGHLVDNWREGNGISPTALVRKTLVELGTSLASRAVGVIEDLSSELNETLRETADDLRFKDLDEGGNLTNALKEMPVLDIGAWEIDVTPGFLFKLSKHMAAKRIAQRLREQIGSSVAKAFYNFGKMMDAWARHALSELELRFDAHADAYRAYLARLSGSKQASEAEKASIQGDLDGLSACHLRAQ
jgi:GTP-binding protein EngB required for normal cell division